MHLPVLGEGREGGEAGGEEGREAGEEEGGEEAEFGENRHQ